MTWRPWRRRDRKAEVSAEIDAHIRMAIADRIAAGETPEEARRRAHLEFGSVRLAVEDARGVWGWAAIEQLWLDARSGARILTHAPGLSATAILLIALVIGGNTTIYSAVHAMLSKPAPGVEARGLASVAWIVDNGSHHAPDTTLAHYTAIAEQSRLLEAAAFRVEHVALANDAGTFAVRGAGVSNNYFDTLGITLAHGRAFSPEEARLGPAGLVAVISERLWHRQFGGAAHVIGQSVRLNGQAATIIGITPAPFQGVWLAEATDLWVPMEAFAEATGAARELRTSPSIHGIVARRTSGPAINEAQAELRAIAAGVQALQPSTAARYEPVLFDYTGIAGRNNLIARFGGRFLAIFSIVTLLTVCIVCANVANLMLGRAVQRQREMAVRQSFGASRWRIVRLVLAENLTLSLAAWGAACVFAYWMSRLLPGMIPASESGGAEVLLDFTPDWNVLAYAMLLSLAAALSFTIAPAMRTWRQDLLSFLKAGERGIVQGRTRATRSLVVLQLALSVVLLTSAGLGLRSLSLISGRDLGFSAGNLLLVAVDMSAAARTVEAKMPLLQSMLDAVRAAPMVGSASYALQAPSQSWSTRPATSRLRTQSVITERNEVGPDFLATLGLSPLSGSEFDAHTGAAGRAEVVVNQHLADVLWPGDAALGKTIRLGNLDEEAVVIGVAPNALIGGYRRDARPLMVLVSARQTRRAGSFMTFYVRYAGSLDTAVPAITRALREAAPAVPVTHVRTAEATLHDMTWSYRALTTLLLMFAGGSLCIAALGQYAAMSFAIRQRIRDFAIRMAMGASAGQIKRSALAEGLLLTSAGLGLGFLLSLMAGHSGRRLLHGVTPTDAATYAGVLLVLGAASIAACYLPALRASRIDPIEALRAE